MKNLGIILVAGVTIPILLLLGFFILWPQNRPPQPAIIISIDDDVAQFEATLTTRQSPYLKQLNHLTATRQARQANFDNQTTTWQTEMDQAQNRLNTLILKEQALQAEIIQLEATQTETLAAQQAQLTQLSQQYRAPIVQLESQLEADTIRLAALNARLQAH